MERDQASKFINDLLKLMVSRNGSDLGRFNRSSQHQVKLPILDTH